MINKLLLTKLRQDSSENISGQLRNENKIVLLKETNYYVKKWKLDGDAPKEFIKAYFYESNSGVRKTNLNSWFPFIAKSAEKWYPHESVTEYMINRIGQIMGILMNEVRLVKANGKIRFLSKYFLNKNETLNHGAEIIGEHLGDMDMADEIAKNKKIARDLFTFEFIKQSICAVFPNCYESILNDLVKMIVFDALVGNNDRHFYNWGIIYTKKKIKKTPEFTPIYDSARGLLWNWSDDNLVNNLKNHLKGGKKVVNYIENAYPRISLESNKQANHFELIKFVKSDSKMFESIINDLSSKENEEKVLEMLRSEIFQFFIPERCELIQLIIKKRFERVRNI